MQISMIPDANWNMNQLTFSECNDGTEQVLIGIHKPDDDILEGMTVKMTHEQFARFARQVETARHTTPQKSEVNVSK